MRHMRSDYGEMGIRTTQKNVARLASTGRVKATAPRRVHVIRIKRLCAMTALSAKR